MPQLQDKLAEFTGILDDHIARGVDVQDLPSWLSKLTIDLISSSMFHTNFDSLKDNGGGDNRGKVYSDNFPLCLKEFGVHNIGTVFRRYCVWRKEHRAAVAGAKAIYQASLSILDAYHADAPGEETKGGEEDTSILGHVVRAPYPNVKERVADIRCAAVQKEWAQETVFSPTVEPSPTHPPSTTHPSPLYHLSPSHPATHRPTSTLTPLPLYLPSPSATASSCSPDTTPPPTSCPSSWWSSPVTPR